MTMRIDFYISSLSGGGAEKVLISLASAFAAMGNDVSIVSLEKRPQFYQVPFGITVIKFDNNKCRFGFIKDFFDLRRYMRSRKADLAISFLSRCNLLVLAAGLFNRQRIVVCDRNNPLEEHSRVTFAISSLLYGRANQVVVQTQQIKGFYPKFLQKKISVIENPLDTQALDAQADHTPEREKVVLSVGRLESQKDFVTLINAMCAVHRDYPDWKLHIFGKGDMHDALQQHIDDLGMTDSILLCGRTSKPYYEMCRSSVFVLSSHYEGFPNVLCEAMYAGALCISSDCVSGPRELIVSGHNGWLFPVGDEQQLVSELRHCMASIESGDELETVRIAAQDTVKRLYMSENIKHWECLVKRVKR